MPKANEKLCSLIAGSAEKDACINCAPVITKTKYSRFSIERVKENDEWISLTLFFAPAEHHLTVGKTSGLILLTSWSGEIEWVPGMKHSAMELLSVTWVVIYIYLINKFNLARWHVTVMEMSTFMLCQLGYFWARVALFWKRAKSVSINSLWQVVGM